MTRTEFIKAIFNLCGKRDDFEEAIRLYDRALTVKYSVDWQRFFDYVAFNLEKRSLPLPKYFIELIYKFRESEKINAAKDIGATIRVFFSSGRYDDYTVTGYGTKYNELIENYQKGDNVTKIIKYPPEVTLIGNSTIPEDAIGDVIYSL